jgi:hypothetical protein
MVEPALLEPVASGRRTLLMDLDKIAWRRPR